MFQPVTQFCALGTQKNLNSLYIFREIGVFIIFIFFEKKVKN